jgi:hypothetical protein
MATPKSRKLESTIEPRAEAEKENGSGREFLLMDPSLTRMMGWPVEMWLRAQTGMLKAAEPLASGWIERRREAADAALDCFEKLTHCNDLKEAATIQRDWFEGAMRRLDTDLHAIADQALALSQEAMSATRYAAQTSSEVVGMAMQTATHNVARSDQTGTQAVEQAA